MAASLYDILPTSYGGRSAFARQDIPKGTSVLSCSGPYASVIFWKFRREVCAMCFAYAFESGKSKWSIKLGEDSKGAGGVWFCSEKCRDACLREYELFEGQGIGWWTQINAAFERLVNQMAKPSKPKTSTKIAPAARLAFLEDISAADVTQEFVDKAWMLAEDVSLEESKLGWVEVLTEFEMDTARFVLDGIVRKVAEDVNPAFPALDRVSSGRDGYCLGAGRWVDMLELQDNELSLVISKPYILTSRIRIYRFLRHLATSLSSQRKSTSGSSTPRGGANSTPPLLPFASITDKLRDCLSTSAEARAIMARDHGNVFGIWDMTTEDEGSEMLGWGAYVFGSYFNHDCAPNLKKFRNGRAIQFYSLRDIRAGEELCISYVDETNPSVLERARMLGADWFFDCRCARCVQELEALAIAG
uniref:SET domain-containing protein n=1 Tax=Psilocybe cubensis TaxID=181762 RepID=A0A8H8CJ56_PSICU